MIKAFRVRYGVIFILCVMYFIAYVDRVNISNAAPLISKELGLNKTQLGWIFSAFAYTYTAMQIVGGWLSDRYGPRLTLAVLGTIWSVATIWTGFAGGIVSLFAARIVLGIGEGGAFPTATRAFTYWLPRGERGFAQGITHAFARLGGAATPPLVLWLILKRDWRFAFTVLGCVSMAWVIWWVISFRDTPLEHKRVTEQEKEEIGMDTLALSRQTVKPKVPWASMIRCMWLTTFVDFCYGWSLWVFLNWLPTYFTDTYHVDLKKMTLFTMGTLMAGVVGDTIGGIISDGVYKRTGNLKLARRGNLVVGLGGAALCIVPVIYIRDINTAVILLAAAFFLIELTNAVLWTLPLDIAGKYGGTAGGMMNTGFGVAGIVSAPVFGYLYDRTGSYNVPFLLSAGLLVIGAISSLFIDPTRTVTDLAVPETAPTTTGAV